MPSKKRNIISYMIAISLLIIGIGIIIANWGARADNQDDTTHIIKAAIAIASDGNIHHNRSA